MELFVGRAAEQAQFLDVLRRASAEDAVKSDAGFVVVVHGHGGIGKTRLLKRYAEIASSDTCFVVAAVDWEHERQLHRAEFAGAAGPPVWWVLDRLYRAVVDAMSASKRDRRLTARAFEQFRKRMTWLPELAERARQLGLDAVVGRQRPSMEDQVALAEAAARLAGAVLPSATVGLSAGASAIGRLAASASARSKAYWSKQAEPEAYASLISAVDDLVRAFAAGLLLLGRKSRPVVLMLDTCEVLGEASQWLPEVVGRAGAGTVWVVGMRQETPADPRDEVLTRFHAAARQQRLVPVPLTPFSEQELLDYLHGVFGDRLPEGLTPDRIAQTTRGLPLAISLVTTFIQHGHTPDDVFGDSTADGSARQIVRALVERHLVHVRSTPELAGDLPLIYGLAMLPDTRAEPGLLGALWDVAPTDVAALLDALARRYNFVLSTSRLLHQDVANAVADHLLGLPEREAVRPANERAVAHLRARLAENCPRDVEGQLGDEVWHRDCAFLLWHTYWIDPRRGFQLLCHLFPAVAVLGPTLAVDLTMIGTYFRSLHTADEQQTLDVLVFLAARPYLSPDPSLDDGEPLDLSSILDALVASATTEPVLGDSVPSEVFVNMLAAMHGDVLCTKLEQQWTRVEQAAGGMPQTATTTRDAVETLAARIAFWIVGCHLCEYEPVDEKLLLRIATTAATIAPDRATAHSAQGMLLAQQKQWDRAEPALREANRLDPTTTWRNALWGITLHHLGHYDEAIAVLRDSVRNDPELEFAHRALALSLLSSPTQERVEEAVEVLHALIDLNDREPAAHEILGEALMFLGRLPEAEASLRRAIEISRTATALKDLSIALVRQGRAGEADPLLREAAALEPDNAAVHLGIGVALGAQGWHEAAVTEFREAVRLDPNLPLAHENLGTALIASGRKTEGEEALRQAEHVRSTEANAPDLEIWVSGSAPRFQPRPTMNDLSPAHRAAVENTVAELDHDVRAHPDDANAYSLLGTSLVLLNRLTEAIPVLIKASALNPEDCSAFCNLGLARFKLGRIDQAIAPTLEAARLVPDDDPATLALIGCLLGELGHDEESIRLYEKCLALAPGGFDQHVNFAISLRQVGRFTDAAAELNKALRLNDSDSGAHTLLGEIHFFLGDHDEALRRARRAINVSPRASMRAHVLLGVLLRDHDPVAAKAAFRTALASFEPHQSHFATAEARAIALVALGDPDASVTLLRKATLYRIPSDTFRKPFYDKLNEPELAGLDHLLAVWEEILTDDPTATRPFS